MIALTARTSTCYLAETEIPLQWVHCLCHGITSRIETRRCSFSCANRNIAGSGLKRQTQKLEP